MTLEEVADSLQTATREMRQDNDAALSKRETMIVRVADVLLRNFGSAEQAYSFALRLSVDAAPPISQDYAEVAKHIAKTNPWVKEGE